MTKMVQKTLQCSIAPRVPRDFMTAPIFPAKKQDKPRSLMVGDVQWRIGAKICY